MWYGRTLCALADIPTREMGRDGESSQAMRNAGPTNGRNCPMPPPPFGGRTPNQSMADLVYGVPVGRALEQLDSFVKVKKEENLRGARPGRVARLLGRGSTGLAAPRAFHPSGRNSARSSVRGCGLAPSTPASPLLGRMERRQRQPPEQRGLRSHASHTSCTRAPF